MRTTSIALAAEMASDLNVDAIKGAMTSACQRLTIQFVLLAAIAVAALADTPPPDPTFHITYGVADWRDSTTQRAAEYKTYRTIILTNTTYSDDEKAAKIARKFTEIRDAVRTERTDAYSAVSEVRGVGNSATGRGATSAAKCISGSKPDMYTKPEWARGAYKSGGDTADAPILATGTPVGQNDIVTAGGSQVCAIALRQSGSGRKVSYSEATFRIRPERVKTIVDTELTSIMYAVSNTPL
jgi:hypothetical protein